jgi:hypothetical protein
MQQAKPAQIVNKTTGAQIAAPVMPETVRDFFRSTGRVGGQAKSAAKTKAARENGKLGGKLGGRPRKHQKGLPKSRPNEAA